MANLAMTAPDLLNAFSELTGIRFAIGAHYQQAQAIELAAAGFTVRDLELVVLWTRKELRDPRSIYRKASLGWKALMGEHGGGDEYVQFQTRLGLANEDMRRGWRPPFKLTAAPAPLRVVPDPQPAPATAERYAEGARQMRAWLLRAKGGAA